MKRYFGGIVILSVSICLLLSGCLGRNLPPPSPINSESTASSGSIPTDTPIMTITPNPILRGQIYSELTDTPTAIPTDTSSPTGTFTPSPTLPPAGIFAIKFYPPLVLDYSTDKWIDKSEYDNKEMMVNYLQNQEQKNCTLTPMGPSGFYPEGMQDITLGSIFYQVLLDQRTTTGNTISYYFAISTTYGSIENEIGIPHFYVQSSQEEAKKCRTAAEEVLATLRRAD